MKQKYENDQVCDCGEHYGVEDWSPLIRAATYAKMKELKIALENRQFQFLNSYENAHGRVNTINLNIYK